MAFPLPPSYVTIVGAERFELPATPIAAVSLEPLRQRCFAVDLLLTLGGLLEDVAVN